MCNGNGFHGQVIQRKGIKYRCTEDTKILEGCENCVFMNRDKSCQVGEDDRFVCSPFYHFVKVKHLKGD